MERELEFKRGVDLSTATASVPSEVVACECCRDRIEMATAANAGWQLRPPVCPNCLRWSASMGESRFHIEKRGRFWAVLDRDTLVCITVYRKGAASVVDRLLGSEGSDGSN